MEKRDNDSYLLGFVLGIEWVYVCIHRTLLANAKCYTAKCLTYSKNPVTVFSHDHHQHDHWYMTPAVSPCIISVSSMAFSLYPLLIVHCIYFILILLLEGEFGLRKPHNRKFLKKLHFTMRWWNWSHKRWFMVFHLEELWKQADQTGSEKSK